MTRYDIYFNNRGYKSTYDYSMIAKIKREIKKEFPAARSSDIEVFSVSNGKEKKIKGGNVLMDRNIRYNIRPSSETKTDQEKWKDEVEYMKKNPPHRWNIR